MLKLDLIESQRQKLVETLDENKNRGVTPSDVAYQHELDRLTTNLRAGKPLLKPQLQSGRTNPDAFNQNFHEISIDINTAFDHINNIDNSLTQHQKLNQSVINTLQLGIKKISDELTKYEIILANPDVYSVYYEAFRDGNNFATQTHLYTERDGQALPPGFHARLDVSKEAVTLPAVTTENVLINRNGVPMAKVGIVKQLGGGLVKLQNPDHNINKIIDTAAETFWLENILVDEPISIELGPDYYNLNYGAVCEFEVNFDHLVAINEISLTPFCEYPLEIVAIRGFTSDNENEPPFEIVGPGLSDPHRRSVTAIESIAFQFPVVQVKRVRVLMTQPHYIKIETIVSDVDIHFTRALFESAQDTDNPTKQDMYEKNPILIASQKALEQGVDINKILNNMPNTRMLNKYQYSYGLYDFAMRRNEYHPTGVYVSKPLKIDGNIKAITLDVTEEHPLVPVVNIPMSNIEYYVTTSERPENADWIPIMPDNQRAITSELLEFKLINNHYRAKTRFPIEEPIALRRNGVKLLPLIDYDIIDGLIVMPSINISVVYTMDYIPNRSSRIIDFTLDKPNNIKTEFLGTGKGGIIRLPYYPYVDRTRLNSMPANYNPSHLSGAPGHYVPIRVIVIDDTGRQVQQPIDINHLATPRVENITDYFGNNHVNIAFNPQTPVYAYRVVGNELHFNTNIPSTHKIIVEYSYLVNHIRVKAILRRLLKNYYGLTPVLKDYTVRFQALF